MACCLLCFDSSPVPEDARHGRIGQFKIAMAETPCRMPGVCCVTYLCPCPSAMYVRYRVLERRFDHYRCCQGYFDHELTCGGHPGLDGACGEARCPSLCLCCEAFLCLGPSMSTSRQSVADRFDLRPDPCDNQLIRLTNCLNCLACICAVAAIFNRDLIHLSRCLNSAANCAFYSTIGCMAGQVLFELEQRTSSDLVFDPNSPAEAHAMKTDEGQTDEYRVLLKAEALGNNNNSSDPRERKY